MALKFFPHSHLLSETISAWRGNQTKTNKTKEIWREKQVRQTRDDVWIASQLESKMDDAGSMWCFYHSHKCTPLFPYVIGEHFEKIVICEIDVNSWVGLQYRPTEASGSYFQILPPFYIHFLFFFFFIFLFHLSHFLLMGFSERLKSVHVTQQPIPICCQINSINKIR